MDEKMITIVKTLQEEINGLLRIQEMQRGTISKLVDGAPQLTELLASFTRTLSTASDSIVRLDERVSDLEKRLPRAGTAESGATAGG